MALLGCVLVLTCLSLSACSDSGSSSRAPATPPLPLGEADDQLAELENRVDLAIRHRRDLTPMINDAKALLPRHPEPGGVHRLLGQAYQAMGEPQTAYDHFSAALALNPDQPDLRVYVASMAEVLGRPDEAEAGYRAAIELDAGHPKARVMLANLMLERGDLEQAAYHSTELINRDSSQHQAYSLLARTAAQRGNLERAVSLMDRAAGLVPPPNLNKPGDDAGMYLLTYRLQQARWLRSLDEPEKALGAIGQLPGTEKIKDEALELAAACYADLDRPLAAARQYEQLLTLVPEDGALAAKAAYWFARAGEHEMAGVYVEKAQRLGADQTVINEARRAIRAATETASP